MCTKISVQIAKCTISDFESSNAFKWFVTARSAIEEFEDTHLRKIRIEVPKDNINDIFEKRRLRRQIKWQHILENCKEYDVRKLLQRLENNKMLKEDFCVRISVAYGMLSKIIHNAMLTPGSGQISFSFLTSDEDVNKAIQIFMQGFEIKDQIIETIK
ncbi:X-ray repair cross-complementing protein 5-like isoform X1 [Aphis craccivora]|uniref:X-ray repair cross-complementing protein 5-like isoform X1 n=1 Tax=Aphis craccivora TaxID=307492 RepID=A0A6G0YST1_APHCR|nr:X-ray repair cross-complementing protein 5-like isoform X1 [Aphis craccivora]